MGLESEMAKAIGTFKSIKVNRVLEALGEDVVEASFQKTYATMYRPDRELKDRLDDFKKSMGDDHYAALCNNPSFNEMFQTWEKAKIDENGEAILKLTIYAMVGR